MAAAESSDPDAFVAALVERWRTNRRSGVSEIYHLYARRLLEIVEVRMPRSMRRSIDPADVVQTVFEHLLCVEPPSDLRRESDVVAYLATAAKNELNDRLRHGTRQRRDIRCERRLEDIPDFEGRLQSAEPTPSEVAMGNEAHERFLRALAELPPLQRDVYVEAKLIGCTSAQGAQRLGLPSADAFRQTLARAIAKLTLAMSATSSLRPDERQTRATEGVTERDG